MTPAAGAEELREQIRTVDWYHTLELAPGLETPGYYDLRPTVDRIPWPGVRGSRCLDVATSDGFWAFELERRGAVEVVAIDEFDPANWDWGAGSDPETIEAFRRGKRNSAGFEIAREALGSSVERLELSVYDLSPERVGTFDVVFCGSLMLHLRDPGRALEAIRGVCGGWLVSTEGILLGLSIRHPRRPVAQFASGEHTNWWLPNVAAYRRMVEAAGFRIERSTRPYAVPLGPRPATRHGLRSPRALLRRAVTVVTTGGSGVPHAALLARPAPGPSPG